MNGRYPLGLAPFCGEPVELTTPYLPVAPPEAVRFDPLTRDFLLDDEGRYEELEPVDQQTVISFSVPRGHLKHAPHVGHDFLTLPRLTGARLDAEIERRAQQATPFADLLKSGAVVFRGVEVRHAKNTESRIVVKYSKPADPTVRSVRVGT